MDGGVRGEECDADVGVARGGGKSERWQGGRAACKVYARAHTEQKPDAAALTARACDSKRRGSVCAFIDRCVVIEECPNAALIARLACVKQCGGAIDVRVDVGTRADEQLQAYGVASSCRRC